MFQMEPLPIGWLLLVPAAAALFILGDLARRALLGSGTAGYSTATGAGAGAPNAGELSWARRHSRRSGGMSTMK